MMYVCDATISQKSYLLVLLDLALLEHGEDIGGSTLTLLLPPLGLLGCLRRVKHIKWEFYTSEQTELYQVLPKYERTIGQNPTLNP